MRLSRLDLVRYGKFTDRRLDFGPARPGNPDLHLVYGPNEAGKSTLFSAVLDLLFGIETRSAYGFLHPYETMRVGGVLETGGESRTVYRIKRKQNTLVGPDDQPLPDTLLSGPLGGIDRATYRLMFSLDDDSIEEGGESILRSEGELGTLLFSASSGLSDVGTVLGELRQKADGFYRTQARKHRLAELKVELEALKERRGELDVTQREFTALRKARDLAAGRYEAAVTARATLRVALDAVRTRLEALPLLQRVRTLRIEHAAFDDSPDPPDAWHQMLPGFMREETELTVRLAQVEAEIAAQADEMEAIPRDAPVLALARDIAALEASSLEARYRTAAEDLPSRNAERAKVAADLAARLAQTGRPAGDDAAHLLLPAAVTGRLRDLAEAQAALVQRLDAASRERLSAEQARAEAADDIQGPDAAPAIDIDGLADLARALRREDFSIRQRAGRADVVRLSADLEDRLRALGLGAEDGGDALAAMQSVPPSADLAAWGAQAAALAERLLRLDDRIAEADLALASATAQHDGLSLAGDFPDDDTAGRLRARRDAAWQTHRALLTGETADGFHATLMDDDRASAARLSQSARLAESRGLALTLADLSARLHAHRRERARMETALAALETEIANGAVACGLPAATTLGALSDWCRRREEALDLRADLRTAAQALAQADAEEGRAVSRLTAAIAGMPDAPRLAGDLEALLSFAERTVSVMQANAAGRRAAAETLKRADLALASRKAERDAAAAALSNWDVSWQAELSGTWLTDEGKTPEPAAVKPVLALLAEIDRLVQRRADLDHRIDAMGNDQAAFADATAKLAHALGLPLSDDPLVIFGTARARLEEARRGAALAVRLSAEAERRAEEAARLAAARERHEAGKRAMLDHFDCESLAEVSAALEMVRLRMRLRERIAEAEADLSARLGVAGADEAEMLLAALDDAGLRHEAADLEARLEQAESELQDRHSDLREAARGLEKAAGDDRAAAIEEQRRTLIATIEDEAMRYLRLRAGVLAGEMALRLYRERHRSAMMHRASAAFATISGGEYSGLSTEAEKGAEFLIANSSAGGSKLARDLSKGTRFQLYLALRMAGFHEIAAAREPLPFIADDIMETFDDNRAFHAFRLMGDMAAIGQVVYLTHHEHLCEIALKACPGATIHRL